MSSKTRKSTDEEGFTLFHAPIETERGLKFRISPLAIRDHVRDEPERELRKTFNEDSVEYRVLSGVEYDEEDPTQKEWEKEYGIECYEDGLVRTFVEYRDPVYSTRRSAEATISDSIFDTLEERTLTYYAGRGLEEAAEELEGSP